MGSRSVRPPPGALTVHELAKMMGMSRQHTNEIMKTMYDAGKIDRMSSGGKFHYFEKK
jgi:DNA-binding IclR family transcriptional regulator